MYAHHSFVKSQPFRGEGKYKYIPLKLFLEHIQGAGIGAESVATTWIRGTQ
jgi:hypothetical protein